MSRIGPENDLSAKMILLDIEDDNAFVQTCSTSRTMRDLCSSNLIWKERLHRYYPDTVDVPKQMKMTEKEFYPIVSLLRQKKYMRLLKYIEERNVTLFSIFMHVPLNFTRTELLEFCKEASLHYIKTRNVGGFLTIRNMAMQNLGLSELSDYTIFADQQTLVHFNKEFVRGAYSSGELQRLYSTCHKTCSSIRTQTAILELIDAWP